MLSHSLSIMAFQAVSTMSTLPQSYYRAQRAYDNQDPPDDDPWRICTECGCEYDEDDQELDSKGLQICDECIRSVTGAT